MFAAQIFFMKNCRNTSSMSFALPRPYKRHYHSDLSIWLSVDPMADKYPGVSPYTYCGNNPVRLVDPDGRAWEIAGEKYTPGTEYAGDNKRTELLWGMVERIYATPLGKKVIDAMNSPELNIVYKITEKKFSNEKRQCYRNSNHTIYLDQEGNDLAWQDVHIVRSLAHEMFHGYQCLNNQCGQNIHNEVEAYMFQDLVCGSNSKQLDLNPTALPEGQNLLTDPYYKASKSFVQWIEKLPQSEDEFNNVFRAIRKEFKKKSRVNMMRKYDSYSSVIPQRNLLRELIFKQ
ncbi:MAG: hypothetical protein J5644_09170 [Bacteroidales bacterium]|nr:hypothetical protein [Bacteroidales bacterium]